jgi:hypothetical protein
MVLFFCIFLLLSVTPYFSFFTFLVTPEFVIDVLSLYCQHENGHTCCDLDVEMKHP